MFKVILRILDSLKTIRIFDNLKCIFVPHKIQIMKTIQIYSIFLFIISLSSCSTDVDLRAPYDDTPIIFGVIDQSVDTQFVKINKSFIGEGDNYLYAAIPDCTIYKNLSAEIREIGGQNRIFPLKEKFVKNIDEGIYYGDSQKVYYFVPIDLDPELKYELHGSIDEGRKTFYAETNLLNEFNLTDKPSKQLELFNFNDITLEYSSIESSLFRFTAQDKDLLHTGTLRFYYEEFFISGGSELKYVDIDLGDVLPTTSGSEIEFSIGGDIFLNRLKTNNEVKNLTNVDTRRLINIEYIITIANQELTTFIDLNEPLTGIVQDRPSYTNVRVDEEDFGKGIFASRYSKYITVAKDNNSSIVLGKYTIEKLAQLNLKFCSDNPLYVGEPYSCQ